MSQRRNLWPPRNTDKRRQDAINLAAELAGPRKRTIAALDPARAALWGGLSAGSRLPGGCFLYFTAMVTPGGLNIPPTSSDNGTFPVGEPLGITMLICATPDIKYGACPA
jgi:hypothetical protein